MAETPPQTACCGKGGSWSPKPGSPVSAACMLCRDSPTYWRGARVDPDRLTARLAGIARDPDWPDALRAEARAAADEGLDVTAVTDSAIITALNARIVARTQS